MCEQNKTRTTYAEMFQWCQRQPGQGGRRLAVPESLHSVLWPRLTEKQLPRWRLFPSPTSPPLKGTWTENMWHFLAKSVGKHLWFSLTPFPHPWAAFRGRQGPRGWQDRSLADNLCKSGLLSGTPLPTVQCLGSRLWLHPPCMAVSVTAPSAAQTINQAGHGATPPKKQNPHLSPLNVSVSTLSTFHFK